MNPIGSGDLIHRVTVLEPTTTPNAGGELVTSFAAANPPVVIPCQVLPISSKERLANNQIGEVVTHRVRMRYLAGMTADKQLQFGSRIFQIDSVIDKEERHIELMLLCFEQKPDGATS